MVAGGQRCRCHPDRSIIIRARVWATLPLWDDRKIISRLQGTKWNVWEVLRLQKHSCEMVNDNNRRNLPNVHLTIQHKMGHNHLYLKVLRLYIHRNLEHQTAIHSMSIIRRGQHRFQARQVRVRHRDRTPSFIHGPLEARMMFRMEHHLHPAHHGHNPTIHYISFGFVLPCHILILFTSFRALPLIAAHVSVQRFSFASVATLSSLPSFLTYMACGRLQLRIICSFSLYPKLQN